MRLVPAVGTRVEVVSCYSVSGVTVYREPAAKCPDREAVEARVRIVTERYGDVSGARVFVVDAYVQCGADSLHTGCTVGSDVTVTDGYTALSAIRHELSHVALNRLGESGGLREFDLERRDSWRRDPDLEAINGPL